MCVCIDILIMCTCHCLFVFFYSSIVCGFLLYVMFVMIKCNRVWYVTSERKILKWWMMKCLSCYIVWKCSLCVCVCVCFTVTSAMTSVHDLSSMLGHNRHKISLAQVSHHQFCKEFTSYKNVSNMTSLQSLFGHLWRWSLFQPDCNCVSDAYTIIFMSVMDYVDVTLRLAEEWEDKVLRKLMIIIVSSAYRYGSWHD